jgi:anti-anti-sigma factor
MKVSSNQEQGIAFVHVTGAVTNKTSPLLLEYLKTLKKKKLVNVVLDLARVDQLDYQVISELLRERKQLLVSGGDLRLVNVNPMLLDNLRLFGFHPFEIYPTRRAALKSFYRNG